MNPYLNKVVTLTVVLLFITINLLPLTSSIEQIIPQSFNNEKELHLLRNEHYLFINASEDVDTFHVWFSFPPDYQYQVPIFLEIYNDTSKKMLHYQIEDDNSQPYSYFFR